jgi:hypothetical protein
MKSEAAEHHYRRQAAECELNAEKAMKAADQLAWRRLAEDWTKLAMTAAVNSRMKART